MRKKCRICGNIKKIEDFHKKKNSSDGHRNECKDCVKDIQKKYKESPDFKEKQKAYDKKRYDENREHILERKKEYHQENKEDILAYKKIYREENEKIIKEKLKIYRENHREEAKEYARNNKTTNTLNQYNYRKNNPHVIAWRTVLHSTLKRLDTAKAGHTIDMLGYSATDLKTHLESQFTDGMTWNNYGDWQIDHIKCVINFDKNSDVSVVCALENLRPLWATTREINGIIYEGNLNRSKNN